MDKITVSQDGMLTRHLCPCTYDHTTQQLHHLSLAASLGWQAEACGVGQYVGGWSFLPQHDGSLQHRLPNCHSNPPSCGLPSGVTCKASCWSAHLEMSTITYCNHIWLVSRRCFRRVCYKLLICPRFWGKTPKILFKFSSVFAWFLCISVEVYSLRPQATFSRITWTWRGDGAFMFGGVKADLNYNRMRIN